MDLLKFFKAFVLIICPVTLTISLTFCFSFSNREFEVGVEHVQVPDTVLLSGGLTDLVTD